MNIPIYRAKREDNGELVEGWPQPDFQDNSRTWIAVNPNGSQWVMYEIDPQTLAVHFPDMIDKNGERIFAALNDSGVGGSECKYCEEIFLCIIEDACAVMNSDNDSFDFSYVAPSGYEVTGIYEG